MIFQSRGDERGSQSSGTAEKIFHGIASELPFSLAEPQFSPELKVYTPLGMRRGSRGRSRGTASVGARQRMLKSNP